MKFKNKITKVVINADNEYEENILKNNSNYEIFEDKATKSKKETAVENATAVEKDGE